MITTITLNASIDKAYRLSGALIPGTVMRLVSCDNSAGGKGLNCARAIATCGEPVLCSGFVGKNNGRMLTELLDEASLSHDFVQINSETRCCINVLDDAGVSTEFLEPGPVVSSDELQAMHQKLDYLITQSDLITFNGSAPQGMRPQDYTHLVQQVLERGLPCIVDTSGANLSSVLEVCPTLIKPNADEIAHIVDVDLRSEAELIRAAQRLVHTYHIPYLVISLGKAGAFMLHKQRVWRGYAPTIDVINPVGSGDTMVGALGVGLLRGMEPDKLLAFAMSCATANCLSERTGSFDMLQAEALQSHITIEEIFSCR